VASPPPQLLQPSLPPPSLPPVLAVLPDNAAAPPSQPNQLPTSVTSAAATLVASMNSRYNRGEPTNDLEQLVLMHTFDDVDGMNERDDLWRPCPSSMWCHRYDQMSATVVSRRLPHYFNQHMGGLILSPTAMQPLSSSVRCAFAYDAGTMGSNGCPGGHCGQPGGWPDYCHWSSSELRQMIEQHLGLQSHPRTTGCGQSECNYNEVVINRAHWESHVPSIVEAFFFPLHSASAERKAHAVYAQFSSAFPSLVATTPLVSYDRSSEAASPAFQLVLPLQPPSPPAGAHLARSPFMLLSPPSTPPSSPALGGDALVARLNARFWSGSPSNTLPATGVLVRQFDSLSGLDQQRSWEPCPLTFWCAKYHAQWPASIVNAHMRHTYYSDRGGFILNPDVVRLFCIYNSDGNSMAHTCNGGYGDGVRCIPGCYPAGAQCQDVGRDWTCSWPPTMMQQALQAQLNRHDPSDTWNELVVDTRSVEADPARAILAFFTLGGVGAAQARGERQAFMSTLGLNVQQAPPLVRLSLGATAHDAVFTLEV